MINIQVAEEIETFEFLDEIELAVGKTLAHIDVQAGWEMSLVISTDEHIQKLNRAFMGSDKPTDVLSFPAGFLDPDSQNQYLGDIIISLPRAVEQSAAHNVSVLAELQLLAVHGTLHLLGYDHADESLKKQMWKIQNDVLNLLQNVE